MHFPHRFHASIPISLPLLSWNRRLVIWKKLFFWSVKKNTQCFPICFNIPIPIFAPSCWVETADWWFGKKCFFPMFQPPSPSPSAPSCWVETADCKTFVILLLRAQLVAFSHPAFQKSIRALKAKAGPVVVGRCPRCRCFYWKNHGKTMGKQREPIWRYDYDKWIDNINDKYN